MKLQLNLILALLASLGTQSTWALEPVNTTNVKIVNPALIKRDALELDEEDFGPAQKLKIQNVMKDLDAQVKNAFKGEDALQAEMSAELKKITSIKNDAERINFIKAYQAKYDKRYQSILAKSNINLESFASRLNVDIPDLQFNVSNNSSIYGVTKTMLAQRKPLPDFKPNTDVNEVKLGMNDFVDEVDENCDPVYGATEYPRKVNNLHASTMYDQCDVLIKRSARVVVPKRTKVTITITSDLETSVWSGGNTYGYALAKIPVADGLPKIEAKSVLLTAPFTGDFKQFIGPNKLVIKTYTNNSNNEVIIERKVAKLRAITNLGFNTVGTSDAIFNNLSVKVKFEPL